MRLITGIIGFFYEILLGCRHEKLTRPFTLEQQTYKVCLDCGRQIYYSFENMRPMNSAEVKRMKLALDGADNVIPVTARVRDLVTLRPSRSAPESETSAAA